MAATRAITLPIKLTAELPWAWEHQCGHLNKGPWHDMKTCDGCRFETGVAEIRRYLLIDADGEQR